MPKPVFMIQAPRKPLYICPRLQKICNAENVAAPTVNDVMGFISASRDEDQPRLARASFAFTSSFIIHPSTLHYAASAPARESLRSWLQRLVRWFVLHHGARGAGTTNCSSIQIVSDSYLSRDGWCSATTSSSCPSSLKPSTRYVFSSARSNTFGVPMRAGSRRSVGIFTTLTKSPTLNLLLGLTI